MISTIIAFLGISLILYGILAGADFGAGIIEALAPRQLQKRQEEVITRAMGPVWEANHIWIIVAIVILFTAFPLAFSAVMVTLHIPLTFMLLGIVLRGCAFTFRHYDAMHDGSHTVYTRIFIASSIVTPLCQGVIAGALILGEMPDSGDFWERYVSPWCNLFCASVGLFYCGLVSYIAAVFLTGETDDTELVALFRRRAAVGNVVAVLFGLLVFAAAEYSGVPLADHFLRSPLSYLSMGGATLLLIPLWYSIVRRRILLSRCCAGAIMTLVIAGWFALQFPYVILGTAPRLDLYEIAAPRATLIQLATALAAATVLVGPLFLFLFKTFKSPTETA